MLDCLISAFLKKRAWALQDLTPPNRTLGWSGEVLHQTRVNLMARTFTARSTSGKSCRPRLVLRCIFCRLIKLLSIFNVFFICVASALQGCNLNHSCFQMNTINNIYNWNIKMENYIKYIIFSIATHVYTMHAFLQKTQNCMAYVDGPCHDNFQNGYYHQYYNEHIDLQ